MVVTCRGPDETGVPMKPTTGLPPGVTRSREVRPTATLETCDAIELQLQPKGEEAARSVIVWRHGPKHVRPLTRSRIRDVRPGDLVQFRGKDELVIGVEIYR